MNSYKNSLIVTFMAFSLVASPALHATPELSDALIAASKASFAAPAAQSSASSAGRSAVYDLVRGGVFRMAVTTPGVALYIYLRERSWSILPAGIAALSLIIPLGLYIDSKLSEAGVPVSQPSATPVADNAANTANTANTASAADKESVRDIILPVVTGAASAVLYRQLLKRAWSELKDSLVPTQETFSLWAKDNAINAAALAGAFLIVRSVINPLKKKIFDNECSSATESKRNENMDKLDALITSVCACYLLQ